MTHIVKRLKHRNQLFVFFFFDCYCLFAAFSIMIIASWGPVYVGWDEYSCTYCVLSNRELSVHIGHMRLEWDCPGLWSNGSTEASAYQCQHCQGIEGI